MRNFTYEDDILHKWKDISIPYLSKAFLLGILAIWILQTKKLTGKFNELFSPIVYELILVVLLFSTGYLSLQWGIISILVFTILISIIGYFIKTLHRFQFYSYLFFLILSFLMIDLAMQIQKYDTKELILSSISIILYIIYLLINFQLFTIPENYPKIFLWIEWLFHWILDRKKIIFRFFGIYFGTSIILVFALKIFSLSSNLSVGVIWLGFSLLLLEIGTYSKNSYLEKIYKEAGILIIPIFIFRHLFVDLQSGAFIWIIPVKFLIEFFGVGILLYWYFYGHPKKDDSTENWTIKILDYFIEAILLFTFLALDSILPTYTPIGWSAICFLLLYLGNKYSQLSRLIVYSSYLHVFIMIYLAFGLSGSSNPSSFWLSQNWFLGILIIGFQTIYIYKIYNELGNSTYMYPTLLKPIQKITNALIVKKDFYLFYPYFFSIFLFLYWSFENAFLTLLWTILSLGIFSLSIILRLSHFRITSLALILFCVVRLIFHDLSSAGTITKAIVFLGVGSILLLMNSLYNKFKDRF